MRNFFSAVTRISLAILIIGSSSILVNFDHFITSFYPTVSFQDLLDGEQVQKGNHVAGDVVYSFPPFASETTCTEHKDGTESERESGNFYIIPTAEKFMTLKTNQKLVESMDILTNETLDFIETGSEPTTQVYCEGQVIEMEDEELIEYYNDYLLEFGYTEAEIDAMGTPLIIEYVDFQLVRIMFIGGIVLVLLGIGLIIRRCKMQYSEEESEQLV